MKHSLFILLLVASFGACSQPTTGPVAAQRPLVQTGIEVLRSQDFALLKGKRVGLITNPTGVDRRLRSTIDILHQAPGVQLVALYGPEHGVRGNFSAGDHVGHAVDAATGVPVYSLYGKNYKPSAEILKGVDVLVYDIQDIGVRSYTYISTMGLAMEAAAENNIEFVVLDRPNPLGGLRFEGPLVEPGYVSFVSQFPIPYVYGLTPGELAQYLNGEGLLRDSLRCKLHVVPLQNWTRNMHFEDTQLPWVPTSPHIPRANSSFFYAISGIVGELDANMIGVGYTLPFEVFALPGLDADKLADRMNAFGMPGVLFRPIYFKPYYMANKGREHAGVQVHITDYEAVRLTEMQFRFLEAANEQQPDSSILAKRPDRHRMFDQVCGHARIREQFVKRYRYDDVRAEWEGQEQAFRQRATPYFLYPAK